MKSKDYCTWFPERWAGEDISGCCKLHDEKCSTRDFYVCLVGKIGKFHATYIAFFGSLGCWVKYTGLMLKK